MSSISIVVDGSEIHNVEFIKYGNKDTLYL